MGLAEIQRTLAHLYTDASLRERFFGDPLKVGRELGLSPEEARQLAELSPASVHSFADSLKSKRFIEVEKLLPMTNRIIGRKFFEYFNCYSGTYTPSGAKKHLGDALAFAAYLEKEIRENPEHERWVLDLLRYEKSRLKAADPSSRVVACIFRHDISRLVRSVARRDASPAIFKRFTIAIWWRPQPRGVVRYIVLAAPELPRRAR
jgi:hypothetical protein